MNARMDGSSLDGAFLEGGMAKKSNSLELLTATAWVQWCICLGEPCLGKI